MIKNPPSVSRNARKPSWLLVFPFILALLASACQGSPSLSPTPTFTRTPTTPADNSALDEPSATVTPFSTEVSSSGSGDADLSDDICSLISEDEAATALGGAVVSTTPGVDADSLDDLPIDFCTYLGQGLAVVLSVVDTGSMDSVAAVLNQELQNLQEEDEVPGITQVTGLGDQAYWTTTSHAGGFIVQSGTVVFSVNLGGNIADPTAYQEALRTLASLVDQRLQG